MWLHGCAIRSHFDAIPRFSTELLDQEQPNNLTAESQLQMLQQLPLLRLLLPLLLLHAATLLRPVLEPEMPTHPNQPARQPASQPTHTKQKKNNTLNP